LQCCSIASCSMTTPFGPSMRSGSPASSWNSRQRSMPARAIRGGSAPYFPDRSTRQPNSWPRS
jgi:hypothetical protein